MDYPAAMLTLECLADLLRGHESTVAAPVREFAIGGRHFAFNSGPAIMGVINLSPDSWYRESVSLSTEAALERGRLLRAQGAAIIDVGAESTLAQARLVDGQGQISRLLPVVRGLCHENALVSVETYHPEVARACLEAGARVLNLTGAADAEEIFRMAADHDAAVILCHVQGRNVREVGDFEFGEDPLASMTNYFSGRIEAAARCGVSRLFIDPGLGFYYRNLQDSALRVRHQMQVFLGTFRLRTLGWPICHALPHAFEFFREEVRCAEPFFAVLAALGGTNLFRTHEVARTRAVLETMATFEPAGRARPGSGPT